MVYLFISTMKYASFSLTQYILIYNIMYGEFLLQFSAVSMVNLYQSNASVHLLSTMHEINRYLYCNKDTKKFKLIAHTSVFSVWLCNFTFLAYKLLFDKHWPWMRVVYVTVTLFLDLEILNIVIFIYIITCKTRKWNDDIEKNHVWNDSDDVTIDIDSNLKDMHHALNSLIEAWNLITETAGLKVNTNDTKADINNYYLAYTLTWL